jgi:hypothetical protein
MRPFGTPLGGYGLLTLGSALVLGVSSQSLHKWLEAFEQELFVPRRYHEADALVPVVIGQGQHVHGPVCVLYVFHSGTTLDVSFMRTPRQFPLVLAQLLPVRIAPPYALCRVAVK